MLVAIVIVTAVFGAFAGLPVGASGARQRRRR
jgi:hypothetical protein